MKRLPSAFYRELATLRDEYGDTEYNRDDELLPKTVELLDKHEAFSDDIKRDAANSILDNAERVEDAAAQGLFPLDGQVALGGKQRVKRGRLTADAIFRRKQVIDFNKEAQDRAWALESKWLNARQEVLRLQPPSTVVEDIEDEIHAKGKAA